MQNGMLLGLFKNKTNNMNIYRKSLFEFNTRRLYIDIRKLEDCLFSRRNGYQGFILFGYSILIIIGKRY